MSRLYQPAKDANSFPASTSHVANENAVVPFWRHPHARCSATYTPWFATLLPFEVCEYPPELLLYALGSTQLRLSVSRRRCVSMQRIAAIEHYLECLLLTLPIDVVNADKTEIRRAEGSSDRLREIDVISYPPRTFGVAAVIVYI
jgi:hypothetical protein